MQRCTVISAWLCVAKRLHRLAACLSAGHRSSPDTPTHPLALLLSPSLHPSIHNSSSTSFLPALASRSATTPTCFRLPSRPLPELSAADTQTPLFHSSAHPFIHLHPPLIALCGNRVIWELGDTSVFLFFPFHPHVWRDFSQFWPCLPVFFH